MNFFLEKSFDFLVSAVGPILVDRWKDVSHIDSQLDHLQRAIKEGNGLIRRSECWRSKNSSIGELLPRLKDAVYEAESIVDELEYQRLKQIVEKSWPGEALVNYFKSWMSGFPERVKQVQEKLCKVCNEMQEACNKDKIPENHNKFDEGARPTTTKYVNATEVYGRDKQLEDVLCLLGVQKRSASESGSGAIKRKRKQIVDTNFETGEGSSSLRKKGNVSMMPIVGMGGVGKTTFAQYIYNDKRVEFYFKKRIWICISDNFDVERLLKEIIENGTKKECKHTTLNTLQETLEEILKSERFLLVLDDAWSAKERDWKDLLDPIRKGIEGSTILITTREPKVAKKASKVMNVVHPTIHLDGLEMEIYRDFLKFQVFDSEDERKRYPELEKIGEEICDKLKGSPLAAITIGALLQESRDVRYWSTIRDSEMWRLKQEEHDILPVLRLSYQYLPAHLKKCFSFCSLYPKDYKFTKTELSKLWIMLGFIECSKVQQHEQQDITAGVYFDELVSRCFFQKAAESYLGDKYVIHDLMHDVCQFMTEDECFCLEDGASANKKPISSNIRHLSIFKFQEKLHLDKENELDKLLSLRVHSQGTGFFTKLGSWCEKIKNVRSLSLAKCKISELPENIGDLKYLKYLDISFTNITMLPESFCELYNLKYLNMEGCSIGGLPVGFEKLVSLQCFHFPKSVRALDGISIELVQRIIAKDLTVSVDTREVDKKFKFLKQIRIRESLTLLSLENVDRKEVAENVELNGQSLIHGLNFFWELDTKNGGNHAEVLEGLCPHSNLQELVINGYGGEILSASWLKGEFLPNLTSLQLNFCVNLITISHLPRSIVNFSIRECSQLKSVVNCLSPEYLPNLKYLCVGNCEELMSLPVELFGRFETLLELIIYGCPKLTCGSNAMVLPPSLKSLHLISCGDLEKSIPSCLQKLSSLKSLVLHHFQHSVSIPAEVAEQLKSLQVLTVTFCAKLQSLGGLRFLASLKKLNILGCPEVVETSGQNIEGIIPPELLARALQVNQEIEQL